MNKYIFFAAFFTLLWSSCAMLHLTPSKKIKALDFEQTARNDKFQFFFPNPAEDSILIQLRRDYPLETVVKDAKNEQEKVLLTLNWVRQQWEHNGWNDAKTNNACTILERVKKGEKFRCVEYGIVLKSALNALGLPARTLGLMTRDVEYTKVSAGHVLAEVWLTDHKKWAMVDAQFDAMPVLDGTPLNAVELQQAIIAKKPFKFINIKGDLSKKEHKNYMSFIPHYLYYFDADFDEKHLKRKEKFTVEGKTDLMLKPIGSKSPIIFQRKYPIDYAVYTTSVADFYPVLDK
jgi:Transglutaminase-like superfamily